MVEGEGPEGMQVLTSAKLKNCCGDLWVSVAAVMIAQHLAPRHVEQWYILSTTMATLILSRRELLVQRVDGR